MTSRRKGKHAWASPYDPAVRETTGKRPPKWAAREKMRACTVHFLVSSHVKQVFEGLSVQASLRKQYSFLDEFADAVVLHTKQGFFAGPIDHVTVQENIFLAMIEPDLSQLIHRYRRKGAELFEHSDFLGPLPSIDNVAVAMAFTRGRQLHPVGPFVIDDMDVW